MKRSLRKITYREIQRSFGRFLSILCIVMLGSGFLYGLRVTKGDMIRTLDDYASENRFFDFHVISTLGLTSEDIKDFAGLNGVQSAEGSVSTDALFRMTNGETGVLKVHSVPSSVNTLKLRVGRMPEASNECVVDVLFAADDAIGKTITLSDDNSADTTGMFAVKTYRVVGLVNSPLYINFSRGTTTLGNGTVSGFVYVPPDAFSTDYYTEAYVRLANTGGVYTDEYTSAVDAFRGTMEHEAKARSDLRYKQIVSDATEQYNSALKQYNAGAADYQAQKTAAERKLANTLSQLDAAEAALPAARAQLDDGWVQLDNAQKELDGKRAEYNTQTADTRAALDAAKTQLDGQWAEYNQALAKYNEAVAQYGELPVQAQKAQLDAAQTQYDAGTAELNGAEQSITDAQIKLDAKRAELTQGESRYTAAAERVKEGRAQYTAAKARLDSQLQSAQAKLADGEASLAGAKEKIDGIKAPSVYVLDRDTNTGYVSFQNDSGIVEGVARVFPLFFFLVAALVCVTTMNRMVDEQRTQIGTL